MASRADRTLHVYCGTVWYASIRGPNAKRRAEKRRKFYEHTFKPKKWTCRITSRYHGKSWRKKGK